MAKQVVIPQDLHSDFDIGLAIANKIALNIDGISIVRNTSGQLEAKFNDENIPTSFSGTSYLDAVLNVEAALLALDAGIAAALAAIPSSYDDEEILTSGLPVPLSSATTVEQALTLLANQITTDENRTIGFTNGAGTPLLEGDTKLDTQTFGREGGLVVGDNNLTDSNSKLRVVGNARIDGYANINCNLSDTYYGNPSEVTLNTFPVSSTARNFHVLNMPNSVFGTHGGHIFAWNDLTDLVSVNSPPAIGDIDNHNGVVNVVDVKPWRTSFANDSTSMIKWYTQHRKQNGVYGSTYSLFACELDSGSFQIGNDDGTGPITGGNGDSIPTDTTETVNLKMGQGVAPSTTDDRWGNIWYDATLKVWMAREGATQTAFAPHSTVLDELYGISEEDENYLLGYKFSRNLITETAILRHESDPSKVINICIKTGTCVTKVDGQEVSSEIMDKFKLPSEFLLEGETFEERKAAFQEREAASAAEKLAASKESTQE